MIPWIKLGFFCNPFEVVLAAPVRLAFSLLASFLAAGTVVSAASAQNQSSTRPGAVCVWGARSA